MERPNKLVIPISALYILFLLYVASSINRGSLMSNLFCTVILLGFCALACVALCVVYLISCFFATALITILGMENTAKRMDHAAEYYSEFFIPIFLLVFVAVPCLIIINNPYVFPVLYNLIT